MSRKKWLILIVGIVAIALIVSLSLVHLGLADDLYNGAADIGGPAWGWIVESYHGVANSSFAQTYIAPPWHAFGFGCLFIGIIALVLWKRPPSILGRFRSTPSTSLATASATHATSTPIGATTRPATTAEQVAPTTEEEESAKT